MLASNQMLMRCWHASSKSGTTADTKKFCQFYINESGGKEKKYTYSFPIQLKNDLLHIFENVLAIKTQPAANEQQQQVVVVVSETKKRQNCQVLLECAGSQNTCEVLLLRNAVHAATEGPHSTCSIHSVVVMADEGDYGEGVMAPGATLLGQLQLPPCLAHRSLQLRRSLHPVQVNCLQAFQVQFHVCWRSLLKNS